MWPFSQTEKRTKFWDSERDGIFGTRFYNFEKVRCNKPREELTGAEFEEMLSHLGIWKEQVEKGYKTIHCREIDNGMYMYSYSTCCGYDDNGFQIF